MKRPEGVKGFVLLPKRWVVGRSFAWVTRLRRLARDLERLPSVFAGLHWAVFGVLMREVDARSCNTYLTPSRYK